MVRKRTSGAEAILAIVAKLPWWGGLIVGFVTWWVFHRLSATVPAPTALQPGQMAAFVQQSMIASISNALQYAIPFLCVIAAAVSWLQRRKRGALVATATASPAVDALNGITWREFESLVAEAFRMQGYTVTQSEVAGPDGGVDVVLRKAGESFLVQCKQWRALKVGVDVVRELYGVMAARGAAGGFVVTSGTFTADAAAFARGRNVELLDGPRLAELIRVAKAARPVTAIRSGAQPTQDATPAPLQPAPKCPSCNSPMVRRTARHGASAGSQFWGCSRFPACRGTR